MTTETPSDPPAIKRSFRDLSDEEVADIEKASVLARIGWTGSFGWDELLRSQRVLIVSEAGAGKTHECQAQQAKLWNAGEPAFFLDLATLAVSSVREMLGGDGEEERLDAWLRSQSDVATFFLDSFDELKLTLGKFDQALKRLNRALAGQLGRARIIITTRPVPIDRELIVRHLPIPASGEAEPSGEAFADIVMDRGKKKPVDQAGAKPWRNVGLMPLSLEQMREFAALQHVPDPDALLADIRQRNAEEFAERPQDLVELCSDWREHHRIRSHREQVETNIATKSKPSTERKERAELSQETAIEGASRLALAAMLTRKLTLRHSADSDSVHASEAALDVSKVLQNWSAETRATLLERPLFGFASYGRVRFHHRSVVEFLAAKRFDALLARGVSIKSIKRLLFTETAQGVRTVRPSMRPVAAWLALSRDTIFDDIVVLDPAVVLDHGDPQSLRPAQRVRALEAYVNRYGRGGWRGLSTPRIQVHRFASQELTDSVKRLWDQGIESPEVRDLLLQIVAAGKLGGCTDIAYAVAIDVGRTVRERSLAIEALLQLNDPRLEALSVSVETDPARWPDAMARHAVLDLFPTYMPVARLSQILLRVKEESRNVGDLNYRLPGEIETADLSPGYLDQLRQVLTDVIIDGITWDRDKYPHLRTKRPDLMAALVAACRRQAAEGVRTEPWVTSSLLAIRLSKEEHSKKDALSELRRALEALPADARETAFWKEDASLGPLHQSREAWHRVFDLSRYGGIQLNDENDAAWVRKRLSDQNEPLEHREMMLWTEMVLLNRETTDHRELLEGLKPFVSDAPSLTTIIDNRLTPQEGSAELRRMEAANVKRTKQAERRAAKAHASWVTFWREIARDPDAVFAMDRAENTAWNLWQAVERSGRESRASGWNRAFIEEQCGKAVAERLRQTMMAAWRKDRPTLRSERPDGEKDTFLVKWQFGLAGIAAEAEDANWAKRLTEQEAELACRYAPMELNGFPSWLESLAVEHPAAVDRVLGEELSLSLREVTDANAYSMFLQNISHASAIIATLFVPRIRAWLSKVAQFYARPNNAQSGQNLRQAIEILVKSGNDDDRHFIERIARQRLADGLAVPVANVWLPALLHLSAVAGVEALEKGLKESAASKTGAGVHLFAELFDRDYGGIGVDLRAPGFTPPLLLRLLRLAYQHVRIVDDAHHEGSYSPDTRDNAEKSRNAVLSALLSATGPEGWAVKLELAADPLFDHLKDRAIALAEERAAEEADNVALTEAEFAILDKTGVSPPTTREALFALMRDRLDDIDDLLLQDISPRELWASITDEHVMRRELARALRDAANQSYTIDQESVTADEKETDIRFRSTGSKQQGAIELKLGDERPGTDLFNTIRDQLLAKYMAADECRAGCLLVTLARDRKWDHPKTGKRIGFEELMIVLNEEAERLSKELGGTANLMAKGLDLRPRLGTERKRTLEPR
ncbi:MAG: ATP-binding protein [Rhizobiales bacterium]|nr:ATP-binding protein [Hyphomicrobiales bacterium]